MPRTDPIEAVVVDDSHFMRTVIASALESGPIEVVATASDGESAVTVVETHEPDVVTMDVEMPGVGGLEAVSRIMATVPTPILMLSAHTDDAAAVSFDAIERGAVDVFAKPGGERSIGMGRFETALQRKVEAVASASVKARVPPAGDATPAGEVQSAAIDGATLVIGASTGGPHAVERLLADLPAEAALRVLVVQHLPEGFTERFAARLDRSSGYVVSEAAEGSTVEPGEALVAPGGAHLEVRADRDGALQVGLDPGSGADRVRPSVDRTLRSAAATVGSDLLAVVLTGMGADGSAGVRRVKEVGGVVLAQDEATAAVFGMPRRAIDTGYVDQVLPLPELAGGILDAIARGRPA